jgi:hypothetical protein
MRGRRKWMRKLLDIETSLPRWRVSLTDHSLGAREAAETF